HHRVGATGDGLGDIAALTHAAVGDDVHVDTRLVEVAHPRTGDVSDGRRLRDADTKYRPRRAGVALSDAHQHTRGTGAHEVQCGLVARATTDDRRDLELADELLQIERLGSLRDVLGGDDGPLDHEDVETGLGDGGGHPSGTLRRDRRGRHDAGTLHLGDARGDELELDGLQVHLLHASSRLVVVEFTDLVKERHRVLVAGPESFEVQDTETTETADLNRGRGRHGAVHR